MERGRLSGLDALRGIAALIVVVGHSVDPEGTSGVHLRYYLTVDLFFMLSGYVMARAYEERLISGATSIREFLRSRLLRLWPTMAVGASIGALTFRGSLDVNLALFIASLGWVPMLTAVNCYPRNPPQWSILFEYSANILHALLFVRLGNRALLAIAVLCFTILFVLSPDLDVGWRGDGFLLGFPRAFMSYSVGIVLYRKLKDRPSLPFAVAGATLPFAIAAGSFIGSGVFDFAFAFACPFLVVAGLATPARAARPLQWLGDISFPLYAVHYPILSYLITLRGWHPLFAIAAALLAADLTSRAQNVRVKRVSRTSPAQ